MDQAIEEEEGRNLRRLQLECHDCWCSAGFQHGPSRLYDLANWRQDEPAPFRWFFFLVTFMQAQAVALLTESLGHTLPKTACYYACCEEHFESSGTNHWSVSVLVGCLPTDFLVLTGGGISEMYSGKNLVDDSLVTLGFLRQSLKVPRGVRTRVLVEVPLDLETDDGCQQVVGDSLALWIRQKVAFVKAVQQNVVHGRSKFGGVIGYSEMTKVLARQRGENVNLCCDADTSGMKGKEDLRLKDGTRDRPIEIGGDSFEEDDDDEEVSREGTRYKAIKIRDDEVGLVEDLGDPFTGDLGEIGVF